MDGGCISAPTELMHFLPAGGIENSQNSATIRSSGKQAAVNVKCHLTDGSSMGLDDAYGLQSERIKDLNASFLVTTGNGEERLLCRR